MGGVEQLETLCGADAGCCIEQTKIYRNHRHDPRLEEKRPVRGLHLRAGETVGAVKALANDDLVDDEFYAARQGIRQQGVDLLLPDVFALHVVDDDIGIEIEPRGLVEPTATRHRPKIPGED